MAEQLDLLGAAAPARAAGPGGPPTIEVPAARLHRDTGDIAKAMCGADIIKGKAKVVMLDGRPVVPTGGWYAGGGEGVPCYATKIYACEAIAEADWTGDIFTYSQKAAMNMDDERRGRFYEGVRVKTRRGVFVLGAKLHITAKR